MTTPAQGSNRLQYQIESVAKTLPSGAQEDFRQLAQTIINNIQAALPGGQFITPGGAKSGSGTAPVGVNFNVTGGNGAFTASITNPTTAQGQTIWHEVSYSQLKSFTGNPSPTVMPPTAGTSVVIPAPGSSFFFRIRSSFDLVNWSPYQLAATTAIDAGLQSSAATSDAGAFNQTNYGVVNSAAVGSTVEVSISGASGSLSSVTAQKGPTQISLPSARIVGVTPGSNQFVGYVEGEGYVLSPTLAGLLANDNVRPVGKCSVVSTATPTLPTIVPVIAGGGIVGYNVTAGGAGASQPYVLTITDPGGPGTGASAGAQTIVAGVLISILPGNPGAMYDGNTVVTPSGGTGGGTSGGGTAAGGNGGRLTAV